MKLFNIMEFISQTFSRMGMGTEKSGSVAKERLRLVLIHDQARVSPELMETLRGEIIEVISKYMEIDSAALEMGLEQRNGSVALAANIPIVRMRREKIAEALQESAKHSNVKTNKTLNSTGEPKHLRRTRKFYSGKTKPVHQVTP